MAKKSTKLGSAKRFGPRYGRTVKHKFAAIEKLQKKSYTCPNCRKLKVKRLSIGIWECKGCSAKFAGKAYTLFTGKTKSEQKQELDMELTIDIEKDDEAYEDEPKKIKEVIEQTTEEVLTSEDDILVSDEPVSEEEAM